MKHNKIKLSAVFLMIIGLSGAQAQEALLTSGGDATSNGGTVSYSVGQVIYTYRKTATGTVSTGVQQPFEIDVVSGIEDAIGIQLEFSVYPNPTTDVLHLSIENYENENITYILYDMSGKVLKTETLIENVHEIPVQDLSPSTYYLKVTSKEQAIKTFRIIKN